MIASTSTSTTRKAMRYVVPGSGLTRRVFHLLCVVPGEHQPIAERIDDDFFGPVQHECCDPAELVERLVDVLDAVPGVVDSDDSVGVADDANRHHSSPAQ